MSNELNLRIGQNVRRLRRDAGLSVRALAARAQEVGHTLFYSQLPEIERGEPLARSKLEALAAGLGCHVDDLLSSD